jgi:hypothetical protein
MGSNSIMVSRRVLAVLGVVLVGGCGGASTGGDGEAACAAPALEWRGRHYVPVAAEADVPLGGQVGLWKYRTCVDSFRVEMDQEGNPTRTVAEGGDEVSVPLYRIQGIEPRIAVSDGARVFVAEGFTREEMPEELKRLLGPR